MRMVNRLYIVVVLLLIARSALLQIDTTLSLPYATVVDSSIRNTPNIQSTFTWNTEELGNRPAQSVADLINQENAAFIKTYGQGSLATSSVRGGSGSHTLVLWNGLPLQSPMLGLLDLSLLPANFVDQVRFQKGGSSSLWGSGAVAGTIQLNSQPRFNQGTQIDLWSTIGSFGLWREQLNLSVGGQNWFSKTRFFISGAKNNFAYSIREDLPDRIQTHGALQQTSVMQSLGWKIKSNHILTLDYWQSWSDREIPPKTTQNISQAEQYDESIRTALNYKWVQDKAVTTAKVAWFNEIIHFTDPGPQIDARSQFKTWFVDLQREWFIGKHHRVLAGLTNSNTKAFSENYDGPQTEHRLGLFASYQWALPRLKIQASLREEFVNGNWTPPVPMLNLTGLIAKEWNWEFAASRDYRLPTLNDQFWSQSQIFVNSLYNAQI